MEAPTSYESAATTTMVSEGEVPRVSAPGITTVDSYSHEYATIKQFLERPYEYLDDSWAQASSANTDLEAFSIAGMLLTNNAWLNKIAGYNLIRGTCVIRIQINANPFQQGRLRLHFIPGASEVVYSGSRNQLLIQKTQHYGVDLDCRNTEAVLRIPYVTPYHYYDLNAGLGDWGNVYLTVLSPLAMDPATSSTTVQYTIWTSFEDFEVAAPVPVIAHSDVEANAVCVRPISTALKAAGKVANMASKIPGIPGGLGTVSWALDVAGKAAYAMGYSKPTQNDIQTYITPQLNRYSATADGVDTAYPISLSCNNKESNDSNMSIRNEDEMSFEYLKRIPCLFENGAWSTTSPVGSLTSFPVSPLSFFQSTTFSAGGHTGTATAFPPFGMLAQYFSQWRGSFKMTLKFVKTQYHTGRLELVWVPGTLSSGTTVQNIGALRTIVDIRFSDEITLDLPYLLARSYAGSISEISGKLFINVLNPLKCPTNVSQSIDILYYIEGGDDLEYAMPAPSLSIYPVCANAHMDKGESLGEQSMSQPQQALSTKYAELSVGEFFTSVKQLLLRYANVVNKSAPAYEGQSYAVNPYFFEAIYINASTGAIQSPTWGGTLFSQIGSMYAYYRGGMRICQRNYTSTTNQNWTMCLLTGTSFSGTPPVTGAVNLNSGLSWQNPNTGNLITSTGLVTHTGGQIYGKIPFYSDCKFAYVANIIADGMPTTGDTPYGYINAFSYDSGTFHVDLDRAVADDFRFGYFVCTPLLLTAYT